MNISELNLFSSNLFNDKRLVHRGNLVILGLIESGSALCNKAFSSLKERVGAYRFLSNPSVKVESIRTAMNDHCITNINNMDKKEHLLIIQDTTELGLINNAKRLAKNANNTGEVHTGFPGFFCHVAVALGAASNHIYGIPHVESHNWKKNRKLYDKLKKIDTRTTEER